jgi:hypothetical protein
MFIQTKYNALDEITICFYIPVKITRSELPIIVDISFRPALLTKCSPQVMSWSPQGMRVLRQYTVTRAEVMFVTIQRENIRPSKKEMNKAVTMLKLPDVCS